MTGTNHAITGIALAVAIKRPEIALPLALLSHFLLDMTPHSGVDVNKKKTFRWYLIAEAVCMVAITVVAMFAFPDMWLLIGSCAVIAFLPDILWPFQLNGSLANVKGFKQFYTFHQSIQWSETKRGFVFEALYLFVIIVFLCNEYFKAPIG
jgi:hypothetical protein